MEVVLYHPEHGYYMSRSNPIGAEGDFYTSSGVDPAMGRMLAGLFGSMAERVSGFRVLEIGAGTGLLARHVLETRRFEYAILERSRAMRDRQREILTGFDVEWADDLPSGFRGCVFSNEFFDALPVRRFRRRGDTVLEVYVGADLEEVEADPAPPVDLPDLRDGAAADVSFEASEWVRRIGGSLEAGYHLAIDYGYSDREFFARTDGTLMCYSGHRADSDPYTGIGEKDITAHVNFSELERAGAEAGLETDALVSQREFLVGLGVLDLIAPLAQAGDAASIRRLEALKNLVLPPMMGDRFRALLQRKGVGPSTLPGFGSPVLSR
jgi:SAM-dependent MidA family methyltransferase